MSVVQCKAVSLLRVVAALGSAVGVWVAADGVVAGGLASESANDVRFIVFWVLPLAVTAVYLGWLAAWGWRPGVRHLAGRGCLAALVLSVAVVLLAVVIALVTSRDLTSAGVATLLYAPLAGTAGLAIGLTTGLMKKRRR